MRQLTTNEAISNQRQMNVGKPTDKQTTKYNIHQADTMSNIHDQNKNV